MFLLAGCQTTGDGGDDSLGNAGVAVVETMNAGGYTYVKLGSRDGPAWYAVPECEVAIGDRVQVADGAMTMRNFESRALSRTFPVIYFASGLEKVQ